MSKNKVEWKPKPIKFKKISKDGICLVAVMKSSDWWNNVPLKTNIPIPRNYVVCQYSNYNDGINDHFEGRITRGICGTLTDAQRLFNGITEAL
jgi:hypothetical protein